jgi:aminoglycoside phosphotransferase (APT) family kinase protein
VHLSVARAPFNILVNDGEVSGVLDWSGFLLADPSYDVAITRVLGKVAAPSILPRIEWSRLIDRYFEHYRTEILVEPIRVGYYEAFRCLWALYEGVMGHSAWSRPEIKIRLKKYFKKKTEIILKNLN